MKQPRRLKAAPTLGRLGRLMALGSEETPEPEAKYRVAQRLGISAAALASAAVTTATAPSAAATAASSGSAGAGSLSAAVGKATGSFVATTLAKATVIGLGLGIASYAGVRVYASKAFADNPSVTVAKSIAPKPHQRSADTLGVAAAASAFPDPGSEAASARFGAASSSNPGAAVVMTASSVTANSLAPAVPPVARFDDVESPAALPSANPISTDSLAGPEPTRDMRARTSAPPVAPRLAREVASLDFARASASRGDTMGALRELNGFERSHGYVALRKEAMLVNIDVLLSLGRRVEAAAIARQLLLLGAPATQRTRLEELVNGRTE